MIELDGGPTWQRKRTIGHLGGSLDKENDSTENPVPYAYVWYRELRAGRGSAFRREQNGLVHAENLAIARGEAAKTRASDRLACNRYPRTSYERLGYWVEVLGVPVQDDDDHESVRVRCAAKFLAAAGNSPDKVDQAIAALLGSALLAVFRQRGTTLAAPPTQTFWPGVNPGPAAYSLGGGCWLSERSHLVVSVQIPDGMSTTEFLVLMNVHLFGLLDAMLPTWMSFNWALDVASGFSLDLDSLDFHGVIP